MVVALRTNGEALGDRAPVAAVFVSDPEIRLDSNQQHLRRLYALTVAEARLAAWLAQGKSVNEAAASDGHYRQHRPRLPTHLRQDRRSAPA